jgi:uncharacterized protein YoaH (UPF0181 family)
MHYAYAITMTGGPMTIDFDSLDLASLSLFSPIQTSEPTDHFVEIYENDRSLIESIRTFMSIGISEGDAALVIATPAHREELELKLNHTIDLSAAREQGLYASFDAEETLARLMIDGVPDPDKFDRVATDLIGGAARVGRNVRVFGEMVALLWGQGNVVGALRLEDLWNRQSERTSFRLFCAYPAQIFGDEDLKSLSAVCGRHSHVIIPNAHAARY